MNDTGWRQALRRYLAVTTIANLIWEAAHLPLYTIWNEGEPREKLLAVLHCTAGDVPIALCAWAFGVIVAGGSGWPAEASRRAALLTIAAGLAYTGFSEWLNTTVRRSWSYSELMPVIPGLRLGWSPVPQWIAIPVLALWVARWSRRPVPRLAP